MIDPHALAKSIAAWWKRPVPIDLIAAAVAAAYEQGWKDAEPPACGYREALEQIASWEKYEEMERPNTDQVAANGDRCIDIARAALERCAGQPIADRASNPTGEIQAEVGPAQEEKR